MSIRSARRFILATWLATISLVLTMFAGGFTVAAQSTDTAIVFRSWACSNGIPDNEWEECDSVIGATYRVEADGVEVAESPVTTVREMGIGPGATIHVPNDTTTITVTQLSGAPEGYVPAPGFDPFTANVADLPEVGFGGESTGPGIAFINVPADNDGNDTSADDNEATGDSSGNEADTLPTTGTGSVATPTGQQFGPAGLLLVAVVLAGAGYTTRRLRIG